MTQATKDMLALAKLHGATVNRDYELNVSDDIVTFTGRELAAYTEAVRAQAAPADFPASILALLQEVAAKGWQDGQGTPLAADAKEALAWIARVAPPSRPTGEPG